MDESMLTGEAVPVTKLAGDRVFAGTINGNGSLQVVVERVGTASTHGRIVQLVQQAEEHRAPILRAAEAYAKWFTPTILALAALVWLATGEPRRAVTMLVVGCPCAFVLATPTAIVAALGRASKAGVLVKGGKYVEAAAKVRQVVFDKTGTLTTGACRVCEVIPLNGGTADTILLHAARLEAAAEHPLAKAVVEKAQAAGCATGHAADIERHAGAGVSERGEAASGRWHLGNERLLERLQVTPAPEVRERADELRRRGQTVLYVVEGSTLRGLISVEDEIRPEAAGTVGRLLADGYEQLGMLTGDHAHAALHVARSLGLEERYHRVEHIHTRLPEVLYVLRSGLVLEGRDLLYVGVRPPAGIAPELFIAASNGVELGKAAHSRP